MTFVKEEEERETFETFAVGGDFDGRGISGLS